MRAQTKGRSSLHREERRERQTKEPVERKKVKSDLLRDWTSTDDLRGSGHRTSGRKKKEFLKRLHRTKHMGQGFWDGREFLLEGR